LKLFVMNPPPAESACGSWRLEKRRLKLPQAISVSQQL
jgi:hypothetical protein